MATHFSFEGGWRGVCAANCCRRGWKRHKYGPIALALYIWALWALCTFSLARWVHRPKARWALLRKHCDRKTMQTCAPPAATPGVTL
eukprot:1140920-Pelagomonas_calceolata.AAC.5